MILADTSIWTSRLRRTATPDRRFADLVAAREIVCHAWVFGELLLGGLAPRLASDLSTLDFVLPADRIREGRS